MSFIIDCCLAGGVSNKHCLLSLFSFLQKKIHYRSLVCGRVIGRPCRSSVCLGHVCVWKLPTSLPDLPVWNISGILIQTHYEGNK